MQRTKHGSSASRAPLRLLAASLPWLVLLAFCASASAEFEIPGVDGERGSVEIEYRGAQHWGLPKTTEEDDETLLRQSHEVEFQLGLTDFLMLRLTPNVEEPDGDSLELVSIGLEAQFVIVPRDDGAFGLAFMLGYGPTSLFEQVEEPDEFEFGPVVELATKRWLLTLNPRLFDELGKFADQDGLGFEYASQLKYQFARRWAVAALMFGEIDELAHPGPFQEQTHVLGPSLYYLSEGDLELGEEKAPRGTEWEAGVGVLFGLTDASADAALRVTFAVEY